MSSHQTKGRLWIGLILVLIGIYLLLHNFGLVPFTLPSSLFTWPSLLILIGLVMIGTKESKSGGLTLVLVGIVFLLPRLFEITMDEILQFWPLIFVFIGAGILIRYNREKKKAGRHPTAGLVGEATDFVDETALLGSVHRVIVSRHFKGGNLTAIASRITVDLSGARLAENNYAISVFVLLGSMKIIIPDDWSVSNQCEEILGKTNDRRKYRTALDTGDSPQLRITGPVILSSVALRNP